MAQRFERPIFELVDENDNPITDMGVDWTSKAYDFENLLFLAAHVYWTNIAITGTLFLEYSCDHTRDRSAIDVWEAKNEETLDGSYTSLMFLDSNLAIASFRLRFVHASGAGDVAAKIVAKP
jgi:hypothetical protein